MGDDGARRTAGFCAIPHGFIRGLAAHPGLGSEARVVIALMSFTYAYKRDGGESPIRFRELVERSDVRHYGTLKRILDRLAERRVIAVQGAGKATRIYRLTVCPTAEQQNSPYGGTEANHRANNAEPQGEQNRSPHGGTHVIKKKVLRTSQEGGNGLKSLLEQAREAGLPTAESWALEVSRRSAAGEPSESIAQSLGIRIREQLEAAQA